MFRTDPNRLLIRRHHTWHCQQEVPRPLRAILGKKRLVVSLKTHDVAVARSRRIEAEAAFKVILDGARRTLGPGSVVAQALEWRDRLSKLAQGDEAIIGALWGYSEERALQGRPMTPQEIANDTAAHALDDHLDHIRETYGESAAGTFIDVAQGRATPFLHGVDSWIADGGRNGPYLSRSAQTFRSDLDEMVEWARAAGVPATVEAFTRQVAGRWVKDRLSRPGSIRTTINRKISAASAYWTWMEKRGHVQVNPWKGQSLTIGRDVSEDKARAFTPDELSRLLSGPADQEIADEMRVAFLTGARLDAIYRLTIGACAAGWFIMPPQMKEPGPRRVPMHTALVEIVARRSKGKRVGDYLFHEPGERPEQRSMPLTKRFKTYRERQQINVTDRRIGKRRDLVNFHSFRRTFIALAEQAGQPPHIISAVVGHKGGSAGMTLGTYSGGPSDAQLRACVTSVALTVV